MTSPATPSRRLALAAALAFLVVSLPIALFGGGERSAYLRTFTTFPVSQGTFGLFGYSYALGAGAIMAENVYYIDQTLVSNGAGQRLSLYFTSVRPLYAFAASLLAPLLGVIAALGLINYLSWAAMAWISWRFTRARTSDPLAATLAVVMTAAGLGAAIHIHDYSPHLLPFAIYYAGVLIVYESRVWIEQRPLRVHLQIGVLLALASLAYSLGMVMAAAYVLVAIRRNRWQHVAAVAVLGVSSQYVWTLWLNVIHSLVVRKWEWSNVQGVEQVYMRQSLGDWWSLLAMPAAFLARVWDGLLQFSNFEFAPLVLTGVIAWLCLRRAASERWFDVVFVALPFVAGLVYLNRSTTRGYLTYPVSIVLYAVIAEALARGVRSGRSVRAVACAAAGVLLIGQLAWSTGFLWGYIVPAKIFFGFGYRDWMPVYLTQWHAPAALSLTGAEPTPIMFGGGASLAAAGLYVQPSEPALAFSPLFALAYRVPIVIYVCALAWLTITTAARRTQAIAVAIAMTWVLPAIVPRIMPPPTPPVFATFYALRVPPGESWRYAIELGDEFVARLKSATNAAAVEFMVPGLHPPFMTTVTAGDARVLASGDEGRAVLAATMPVREVIDTLASERRITVQITARREGESPVPGVAVFGWQRAGLPGRTLASAGSSPAPTLPAFEVRLLDAASRPILIGF